MIPVCDMKPQYSLLSRQIQAAVKRVLQSGTYMLGKEVYSFETECSAFIGLPYAASVASGTDAIELAIRSLDVDTDSQVIVPANSYPSIWGVLAAGVKPVICDIDPSTLCLDERKLAKLVSPQVRAILVVHLYGVNMLTNNVLSLAKKQKVLVIEDCAQSFGARNGKSMVGTNGDIATFSFYPTKPLGAFGDGGMIMTRSRKVYEKIQRLRMYGESGRYNSIEIGTNSRLDEIQAAMLRVKLSHVVAWIRERKNQAIYYRDNLKEIKALQLFESDWWEGSAHHLFVIRTKQRDKLQEFLKQKGIGTSIHYPRSLSQVHSLRHLVSQRTPAADLCAGELLSLPLYNGLRTAEQKIVVQAIKEFFL